MAMTQRFKFVFDDYEVFKIKMDNTIIKNWLLEDTMEELFNFTLSTFANRYFKWGHEWQVVARTQKVFYDVYHKHIKNKIIYENTDVQELIQLVNEGRGYNPNNQEETPTLDIRFLSAASKVVENKVHLLEAYKLIQTSENLWDYVVDEMSLLFLPYIGKKGSIYEEV